MTNLKKKSSYIFCSELFQQQSPKALNCSFESPCILTSFQLAIRMNVSFQEETRENVTVSDLSFVPTTDDDGKSITCRAENPNITGAFLESSWKIDVVCKSLLHDPNL